MSPLARRRIAGALIALATLVMVLASCAWWLRATALDSSRWAETVAPLPAEEPVADALAEFTVDEVVGRQNLLSLSGVLPEEFEALPGTPEARLGGLAEGIAAEVIASEGFARVWSAANVTAHRAALAALDGRGGSGRDGDGAVVLDLSPVVVPLREDLSAAGIRLPPASAGNGRIEVLTVDERSAAAQAVRLLRDLAFVLPVLAAVLIGIAVLVQPRRLSGLTTAGAAMAVAGLGTLAGLRIGLSEARHAVDAVDQDVVRAIGDVLTRGLVNQSLGLAAAGGAVAVGAWAAGALRREAPRVIVGPPGRDHRLLPWAGPGVALIGLLVWPDPRLAAALGVVLIAAAWWLALTLVLRRAGEAGA